LRDQATGFNDQASYPLPKTRVMSGSESGYVDTGVQTAGFINRTQRTAETTRGTGRKAAPIIAEAAGPASSSTTRTDRTADTTGPAGRSSDRTIAVIGPGFTCTGYRDKPGGQDRSGSHPEAERDTATSCLTHGELQSLIVG
jgi:hypothetical protein